MRTLAKNEAINRKGEIVRVRAFGGDYGDFNRVCGNYHMTYDEDEVYHIETNKGEIILAFSCSGWNNAMNFAKEYLKRKYCCDVK